MKRSRKPERIRQDEKSILLNGNTLFEFHIPCRIHQTGVAVVRAGSVESALKALSNQEYAKVMYTDDKETVVTQNGMVKNVGVSTIKPKTSKKRPIFD